MKQKPKIKTGHKLLYKCFFTTTFIHLLDRDVVLLINFLVVLMSVEIKPRSTYCLLFHT